MIIKELANHIDLTDQERRQLKMSNVRTAEDLFSFLLEFPELVEGTPQPRLTRAEAERTTAPWREQTGDIARRAHSTNARSTQATHLLAVTPTGPLPGPGARGLPSDPATARYVEMLDFAWARTTAAFQHFAVTCGPAIDPPDGADLPSGARLRTGTVIPTSVLDQPLRRQREDADHGWRLELDVEVERSKVEVDVTIRRGGRMPTPISAGDDDAGDPWDDYVVAMPPLGEPVRHEATAARPVRNQGNRGTCTAFAVLASAEHITEGEDLSEEHLFRKIASSMASSSTLAQMAPDEGVCREGDLPYSFDAGGAGAPPASAPLLRFQSKFLDMPTVEELYRELSRGRAPAISLPVWRAPGGPTNWNTLVGRWYGHVLGPPAGAELRGGHAVCVVGYEPDPSGGYFILRNSWGEDWGQQARPEGGPWHPRPGYGYIRAATVRNTLLELRSVRKFIGA